jgi:hypothetical protein
VQKTLCLQGMNWHNATNPKLKEGKVRELNPEFCPDFFDFWHFGRVFAETGGFLTFWGIYPPVWGAAIVDMAGRPVESINSDCAGLAGLALAIDTPALLLNPQYRTGVPAYQLRLSGGRVCEGLSFPGMVVFFKKP